MPPIKIVYACATCALIDDQGLPILLEEGEPWAADDPLVKARPNFFSEDPPLPNFPRRSVPVIEQTSAAPSERRTVKRG